MTNTPAHSVPTGNRPEGLVVDGTSLFVAVRARHGPPRWTLTVLTEQGDIPTLDPALVVNSGQVQLAVITGDGLTGFRRVAGSAGNALVPDLAVSIPAPTHSALLHLQAAARDPVRERRPRQPADFRRGLERPRS